MTIESLDKIVTQNSGKYEITYNNTIPEIHSFKAEDELCHKLLLEFSPAIPNIQALWDEQEIEGKFSVIIGDKKGVVAGK